MFNRIKKTYLMLAVFFIIAGISLINVDVAHAASLKDIESSADYAKDAIIALANQDIIAGDANGNFNPQNTVTRAEMITMIVKALGVDTTNVSDIPTFQDVPKTHWAYEYVEAAYREGIVVGMSEDVFGRDVQCTREQMTVMFVRSLGIADQISVGDFSNINQLSDKDMVSSWAKDAVEFSLAAGLMHGTADTTFSPKGNAQRQQVAVVTHRVVNDKNIIVDYAVNNSNMVKHADLYQSFGNNEEYKGEVETNVSMNLYGATPEETMTFTLSGKGAINGMDSHMTFKTLIRVPGLVLLDLTYELIVFGDEMYIREEGYDTWLEVVPEDMEAFTPLDTTPEEQPITDEFFNVFNKLQIKNDGIVVVDGVNITKYTITLDETAINEILSSEFFAQDMGIDEGFEVTEFTLGFFINEHNQIIKESFSYNGTIEEEGEVVSFDMGMEMWYKNIGTDIEIIPPAIEDIEPFLDEPVI